jgi:ribonuclease VapC
MPTGTSAVDRIVLDSSILLAILFGEADFRQYNAIIRETETLMIGAPTLAEAGLVVQSRQGPAGLVKLLSLLDRWKVAIVDFTGTHAMEAIDAHRRYGRGNHPAALNMGDCNSYAVAKVAGVPLLYKGNDFALTDLPVLTLPEA